MKRIEAWSVHLSNLLVAGTGLVYAWMRYFATPTDPYSVVNHPWQPAMQHWHVLLAPLVVFAAGLIWREHVWKHWKLGIRRRRRSGISLVLTLVPMVASGYLIQTAVSEGWRNAWVAIHLVASGLWILGYAAHLIVPLLQRRRVAVARRAYETEPGEHRPAINPS